MVIEEVIGHGWLEDRHLYLVRLQPSILTHQQLFQGHLTESRQPLFDNSRVYDYCMQEIRGNETIYAVKWHEMWVSEDDVDGFSSMVQRYWRWDILMKQSLSFVEIGDWETHQLC